MSTPADKDKDKSAPAAAPTPAAKDPAPATNGDEAEAADGKAEGKDKEAAAAPKAPHPLDGLSQAELRKKLDGSKQGLRAYLERKKKLDQELASLEASIFAFEGSYLSDQLLPASSNSSSATAQFGNIIKGYDSYLKAPAAGSDRKRGRGNDEPRTGDRMFSLSSGTFSKAVEMRAAEVGGAASESEEESSSSGRRKRNRH